MPRPKPIIFAALGLMLLGCTHVDISTPASYVHVEYSLHSNPVSCPPYVPLSKILMPEPMKIEKIYYKMVFKTRMIPVPKPSHLGSDTATNYWRGLWMIPYFVPIHDSIEAEEIVIIAGVEWR